MNLFKVAILSTLFLGGSFLKLNAQTQLELSSGSLPSPANGATVANQTATKLENTTGSTFVAYSPTITVTAAISNQQYAAIPTTVISTGTGIVYGANTNSLGVAAISQPVYNLLNSISSPANASFTSNPNGTAGTGQDVAVNSGFSFYNSVYPLYNTSASLTGRFYYGDLTLTFNRPVSDPVLQISGLGGNVNFGGTNIQGFSTELELQTSGVTASKLSGTTEFSVSANKILNNATTLSYTSGSGAASGSVKVAGTNITTLTFKIYVRGDGKGTAWASSGINAGDVFVMGVSMNKPITVSGTVYNDNNGLTDNTVNGTGTNVGGSLYINIVDGNNKVVASVAVAADGTYSLPAISAGTYTALLSTTQGTQGATAPSATLPAGYVNTGEYVGSGTGSDGTINGITSFTVTTTDVPTVNFGIFSCPTITNPSAAQTICIGQSGSNITVNTSTNTASGYRFVRFTSDQIAGASPTAAELAAIYAGTAISTVTPTGGSAPYTATYTWNSSDFPNATTSTITYYVYAIANPDPGTTCRPVQEITVVVNALPVIAAITGTTSVCVGQTTTLADATSGGVWKSVSTGVATINASTGVVTGVSAGNTIIRYTVTNGNGCKDSVSTTVTVNALPVIAAITGGTTICVAKTTQLSDATASGVWKSVSTGVATINSTGLVTGVAAGTSVIRYTVTNGNGCVDSVSTTVTVNALPVIAAITGGTTICVAKTTQLSDATASGVWTSVSTGVATVNSTGLVTGVAAGTSIIRYTVTNGNGCVDSVSTTVTVNALPVIAAITGGTTICVAKTTQLADATASGVWTSVSTGVATVNSTGLVTGVSAGTSIIRYTVTNGNGCVDSVSTTVTVNALPVIAAITGSTTICVAKTTQLADATTSGVWTSVSTGVATVNSTGLVTGVSAGTSIIRYTVTNGNGCVDSVSTTVTVNALPVIAAITGSTTICVAKTTQLADATTSGVWTSVSTGVATVNSTGLVTGVSAGTSIIRYTVTNANGCVDSVSTTVTVNALPVIAPITGTTSVCASSTTQLADATTSGVWTSTNTSVATVNSTGLVSGISAGTSIIRYTVTNGNGCVDSVSTTVTVNALPVVVPITGNTITAVTDQITLSNATSGGVWSSGNTAIATISATGVVTGVMTGTVTISYTVTNASGCVTTVTYVVTVNPKANG